MSSVLPHTLGTCFHHPQSSPCLVPVGALRLGSRSLTLQAVHPIKSVLFVSTVRRRTRVSHAPCSPTYLNSLSIVPLVLDKRSLIEHGSLQSVSVAFSKSTCELENTSTVPRKPDLCGHHHTLHDLDNVHYVLYKHALVLTPSYIALDHCENHTAMENRITPAYISLAFF